MRKKKWLRGVMAMAVAGESAYIGSTGKPAGTESVSSSEADR